MKIYIDTSVLVSSITDEEKSDEVRDFLDSVTDEGLKICSSIITETELRRTIQKLNISQNLATEVLDAVELLDTNRPVVLRAGLLGIPKGQEYLRSLDAIHVATAELVQPKLAVTLDKKQGDAFMDIGLKVHNFS